MLTKATPPHTLPHPPPDTMGRWPRRLRPLLYFVLVLFLLMTILGVLGQLFWSSILFVVIFITVCIGVVYTRTHPEEDYSETMFPGG
ncbi:MAG: hypothetical protein ACFFCW_46495 [Candidatus Hodarchaeota archaeon]